MEKKAKEYRVTNNCIFRRNLVSHDLLIQELSKYGVKRPRIDLLRTYIMQCVFVIEEVLKIRAVTIGVQQGSVLGLLLFILYFNYSFYYLSPGKDRHF